jgi:hypothetical protein
MRAGALGVGTSSASSAQVSWTSAADAAVARVFVNGRLIDEIPATGASGSYNVQQLWPSSKFPISVVLRNGSGENVGRYVSAVSTRPLMGSFPRLFSSDSFINLTIGPSPSLEANSSAIVSQALASHSTNANLANSNSWGIPVFDAASQSTSYDVGCTYYDCWYHFGPVNIPSDAQPQWGSDRHMVVMQPDGQEFDMWLARRTGDGWTSGERWETNPFGSAANCSRVHGCGAADVAGFALTAGMIRPEEIAQGHIDHALAISTPDTRADYIACPATDTDGRHASPDALPVGAHIQLDPTINVAGLPIPRWERVVAAALQQYGAYVIDTGGSVALSAESNLGRPYDAWARADVPADSPSLANLPWKSMRVLSMARCG